MSSRDSSDSHGSRRSCSCSWMLLANVTPRTISCLPALRDLAKPRWP